jgi:hypothetical protein
MYGESMVGTEKGTLYIGLQLVEGYELISDDKIAEELFQYVGVFVENLRHFDLQHKVSFCLKYLF